MQRHLLIMRHAQAEEIQQDQTDRNRELTGKGQQEALQMGYKLFDRKISIDAIYASAAVRTKHTASLVADTLKIDSNSVVNEEELYNSSIRSYLGFLNLIEHGFNNILVVGHNPSVSYLAEYLSGAEIGSIPTGGICILRFENLSWGDIGKASGELVEFIYPDRFE